MRLALAIAAFQAVWFSAVLGAAKGLPWLGPCTVAVAAAFFARSRRALGYLTACAALGFALDSGLAMAGLLRFPLDGDPVLSPAWMVALWVNFAWFVPVGLRAFYGRPGLAAGLGAAGGPAAYWAGERLGALEWSAPEAVIAVAAEWAVASPAVFWMAARLNGPEAQA